MSLPLDPYTVIDLTRARSGPTCVRQLADMGAHVIQISAREDTEGDFVRRGFDSLNLHRNKRSLTLDLKSPRGIDIIKRLVAKADVVVENFRPDVKHRLGIDYETLSKLNPRLIYASISGFGQTGPYRDRPGYDQIAQGMGGLMSVTGLPGQGPVRVGIPDRGPDGGDLPRPGRPGRAHRARALGQGAVGAHLACSRPWSRCSTSRPRAGSSRAPSRRRRATTIRPAFRPACSRRRTATSTSPPRASTCSAGSARPSAPSRCWRIPRFKMAPDRSKNRKALTVELEKALVGQDQRRVGRAAERQGRALGSHPQHQGDLRERAGAAPRARGAGQAPRARRDAPPAAARDVLAHASLRCARPPRTSASTPTRSWASSVSPPRTSRGSARDKVV